METQKQKVDELKARIARAKRKALAGKYGKLTADHKTHCEQWLTAYEKSLKTDAVIA